MKRVVFAAVAVIVPLLTILFAAELVMRWRSPAGEAATWLVPDTDLGFKLNPASDRVNTLGFRGPAPSPPEQGRTRVLVIGDSVAFDLHGFVHLLGERLKASGQSVEILNAAIPGYTTHQQRIFFERDLVHLSPDLVLLQYCINDNHRFLHHLDERGQWVITKEARAASEGGVLDSWLRGSALWKWARWRVLALKRRQEDKGEPFPWNRSPEFANAWLDETWPAQEESIGAIHRLATSTGARVALVAVPHQFQFEHRSLDLDRAYTLKPQRMLGDIAERRGLPLLDLHPVFAETGGQALYRDKLHLSPRGHVVAAEAIQTFLTQEALLEPDATQ